MKKDIKSGAAAALELPGEVIFNLPVITLTGRGGIDIENYKSILEYSDTSVSVNTSAGIVSVCGEGLELKSVSAEYISVKGVICSVMFKEL